MKSQVANWKLPLLVAAVFGIVTSQASVVTWTSGRIVLPDGTYAQAGDVCGYAFVSIRSEILQASSFYDMIHNGITQDYGYASIGGKSKIDYSIVQGQSDKNGEIDLTAKSLTTVGQYNNQWAKVYYTCIQDGYEYYMAINANHYETASSPNMLYENLASYGTWQQGYAAAIPEPTTAWLALLGVCVFSLRRQV